MKKYFSSKIILFTFTLLIHSCGIYVQYDYDSDVNFNNYSSFSFYQTDIDKIEISDIDKKRILRSLDLGLKSKGLKRSNSPDLLVSFETKSKERVYVNNYLPYGWHPFSFYYPRDSVFICIIGNSIAKTIIIIKPPIKIITIGSNSDKNIERFDSISFFKNEETFENIFGNFPDL